MFSIAIFDLNGTIIEDEPIWRLAFNKVFKSYGGSGEIATKPGIGNHDNWRAVQQENPNFQEFSVDALSSETKDAYLDLAKHDTLGLRSGYRDFVAFLQSRSVLCVLATSSSMQALNSVVALYPNVLESFTVIVHGDEVERRKPAPDIFLKALEKVNDMQDEEVSFGTEDCVVFEDSNAGVRAAKAAGMFVVHLPNGIEPTDSALSPDIVATDFTDKRIFELFEGGEV